MTRGRRKAPPTKVAPQTREKVAETEFFAFLNRTLKPLGFQATQAVLGSPLLKTHEQAMAHVWPLPHLMIKARWQTREGHHQRMNARSAEIVAEDKRDLVKLALAYAQEHKAELVPNDGHPMNDARNWDQWGIYSGPEREEKPDGRARA